MKIGNSKLGIMFTVVLFIALTSMVFGQGSLTPPGSPAATMKTLAQVEPRTPISIPSMTITKPGSYYLVTNLVCNGVTGITIATNNVTLDLNGFSLIGNGAGVSRGISTSIGRKYNFILRNGTITGFGGMGMDVSVIYGGHFEDLMVSGSGASGMAVGDHSRVINCRVFQNGSAGILTGDRCIVTGCESWENGTDGIAGDYEVKVVNCITFSNLSTGIVISGGLVEDCVSTYNSNDGIDAGSSAHVMNNTCNRNGDNGIAVSTRCIVRNNDCTYNGRLTADGAGIYAASVYNRIEDNHVVSNDRGISCPSSPNLVARNSAAANTTDYNVLMPGNRFAPVDTSSAFTNAWANFDF